MIPSDSILRQSKYFEIFVLSLSLLICMVLLGILSATLAPMLGIDDMQSTLDNFNPASSESTISAIRIIQMLGHLFIFVLPPILFLAIANNRRPFYYLFLDQPPIVKNLLLGMGIILFSMPLMQLVYWLNMQIPLPEALSNMEEQSAELIKAMLDANTTTGLVMNLLAIALLPALGEELLFRGVLQRIFTKIMENPHKAIWLTAMLFSLMHMQFAGFFPRLFLGALLGYLLYWSGNLLVPIFAHFLYNGSQIIAVYQYNHGKIATNIENMDHFPHGLTLIFTILFAGLCWLIYSSNKGQQEMYVERIIEENENPESDGEDRMEN